MNSHGSNVTPLRPLARAPRRIAEGANPLNDLDAERAVLGAVLLDNAVLPRIAHHVGAEDFYDPRNAVIWLAFGALWEAREPIDIVTSAAQLRAMERLNTVGGAQYLGELTDVIPTVAHCESHATIVADLARARRYREALDTAAAILDNEGDPAKSLERALAVMTAVKTTRRGAQWKNMRTLIEDAWDRLIEVQSGAVRPVPTGYVALDGDPMHALDEGHFGGGFRGGELIVIAADQGGGKTAWAMQLLLNDARLGFSCLFVSQEMDGTELHWRWACSIAGVSSTKVRSGKISGDELKELQKASRSLDGLPIRVRDAGSGTTADIRVAALSAKAEGPVDLIVIDYLQILDPPVGLDPSRTAEIIDANALAMKKLAREMGCPVVLLSQFNRAGQLAGRKPRIQDLKGSGGIESHADIVIVLHPTDGRRDGPPPPMMEVDLLALKGRGVNTAEVKLRFERKFTRFVELRPEPIEGAVPESGYQGDADPNPDAADL